MLRSLAALMLLLMAAPAPAAAQPVAPQVQRQVAALAAQLGLCHRARATALARARLTPDQIADRALADCAGRERPLRQYLVRNIGQARADRALAQQRLHWRQTVRVIVQQIRATSR
jgi:hypothetical protein